jgi:hypothetical protein
MPVSDSTWKKRAVAVVPPAHRPETGAHHVHAGQSKLAEGELGRDHHAVQINLNSRGEETLAERSSLVRRRSAGHHWPRSRHCHQNYRQHLSTHLTQT